MIDLAYGCGLRRRELHALDLDDICFEERTIRVTGKRGAQRLVPVGEKTLAALRWYLYSVRPLLLRAGATRAVFVSRTHGGKRMHLYSINAVLRRLRKSYGFDRSLRPHALRHAFATDLLLGGAPVQDVSRMLGHRKLETTQVYTRLTPLDLREHFRRHHPRA